VKIWIDAQISPEIAQWFILTHGIEAMPIKDLGLRNATDRNIFLAAFFLSPAYRLTEEDQNGLPPYSSLRRV